jgi:hypothetical protein
METGLWRARPITSPNFDLDIRNDRHRMADCNEGEVQRHAGEYADPGQPLSMPQFHPY